MFGDYFLDAFFKRLSERLENVKDSMFSGTVQSMEDYRFLVGKIKAYEDTISLLRETYAQFFENRTIYSGRDEDGDGPKY